MLTSLLLMAALGAEPAPRVFNLNTPENVWDVAAEDLNGDGTGDILALNCDERSYPLEKYLSVFLSDGEAYPPAPSFDVPLDPMVGSAFLAEIEGGAPREVLATDSAGATVYQFRDGQLRKAGRIEFTSLLPSMLKEPVFVRDAAKDLDGDGAEEWLIPQPTGYQVRTRDAVKANIACDVVGEIFRRESTRIIYRLPAYHTFDLEGSPTKGIAFLSDEFADFAHGPGWTETERFRIPVNLEEKWEASASMADVDNNGFPDLMVTQTRGTINLEARTQIYLAAEPFTFPDKPTAQFVSKGGIASPMLIDIDGDQRKDVLVIGISFGLKNIISFFTRGRITVSADVHLFDGAGYGAEPAYRTDLTLEAPEGREQVAYALADFSGDGRVDLAFGEAADRMTVKLGEADRFVSGKPWAELTVPGFGVARNLKLAGETGEDLILFHPSGKNPTRIEAVLF